MREISEEEKREIIDEWLRLRDSRVAKQKRLKALAEKHGVTQKAIKEITIEFNVWTLGSGHDLSSEDKKAIRAEQEAAWLEEEEEVKRSANRGCTIMAVMAFVIVLAYFGYVYYRKVQLDEFCKGTPQASVCTSPYRI